MPVTVYPARHPARAWTAQAATSEQDLLASSCRDEAGRCRRVLGSSFVAARADHVSPSPNGLVWAAYHAYSGHHHLALRPEDVWFAVLAQLGFYVNAFAEELRSLFVAHAGREELVVRASGTLQAFSLGPMAVALTREMDKHLVDPGLRQWIMPAFTTTTDTDIVTAAVLMMGTLQKYFSYTMSLTCGIPSVTLLGERADWVDIRGRLDKLRHFGREPERFGRLLIPVLDHFIGSFDRPEDPRIVDFWSKIADRYSGGSGPTYLSGWITAFCFWDAEGYPLYRESPSDAGCAIAGTVYYRVDMQQIPGGYMGVPVKVDDNGREVETRMVAGSIAIAAWSSGGNLDTSNNYKTSWSPGGFTPVMGPQTGLDSLRPVTGWWMYEVGK